MMSSESNKPFLPRWVFYALLPGFIVPVLIFVFIVVSELAHDESRCPYASVETRRLGADVSVREDRRNCLWHVEERRYSVVRGANEHMLGRRRFDREAFAAGHYHWDASLSPQGEVKVSVHNDGHDDAAFREGTKAERRGS